MKLYRHFKGGYYTSDGEAINATNGKDESVVIYTSLLTGARYVREYSEFHGQAKNEEGEFVSRFKLLDRIAIVEHIEQVALAVGYEVEPLAGGRKAFRMKDGLVVTNSNGMGYQSNIIRLGRLLKQLEDCKHAEVHCDSPDAIRYSVRDLNTGMGNEEGSKA